MMPETARDDTAATDCELVRQRADALLDQFAALMADVAQDRDRPDLARRMPLLTAGVRELRAHLAGHETSDAYAEAVERRAYERGRADERAAQAQRKGRHAAVPAQRSFFPRLVQGIAGLPVLAKLGVALGAVAVVGVTGAGAGIAAHDALAHPSSSPAAAAPSYDTMATPLPSPSSSPAALTHPKVDAAKAGQLPVPVLALPSFTTTTPDPAPSVTPSSQQQPAAGTLTVTTPAYIDLGAGGLPVITIEAQGGRVVWAADCADRDVTLDSRSGLLEDGQSLTINLTVSAAALVTGGTATIVLDPGHEMVTVTWPAAPVPPPSATPSPSSS